MTVKFLPPFVVEWRKVLSARPAVLREIIAAAEHAVRARDEEIAALKARLRAVAQIHAVTEDLDPLAGDYYTWDHDGRATHGLWILEHDRPLRIAMIAPGDRVFVLRRRVSCGPGVQSPESPAGRSSRTAG